MAGTGSTRFGLLEPAHREWLQQQREQLLDFYQPNVRLGSGGMAWLSSSGRQLPDKGAQLWLGARMIHVFALAAMMGRVGAADIVEHGLDFYLDGPGEDREYGGWFPVVGGVLPADNKELYGIAHVALAGSTATIAGFERGAELRDRALALIDKYYWDEQLGRCREAYDRTFSELDPYRGQNANMHLTEAYLAAFESTGDDKYLDRAARIARFIAGRAVDAQVDGAWRLPEHFSPDWEPLLDYNLDQPRHPFRPYGSQPGHWLEWAKLLLQLRGLGRDEPWILPTAQLLFAKATEEAWGEPGGFAYTVDWDGKPVVGDKYFWAPAEAIGAAKYLYEATGEQQYLDWYRKLWKFVDQYLADHQHGSWHHEIGADGKPAFGTWEGKPDVYHAYQATLYALLPPDQGLAVWACQNGEHA